MTTVKFLKCDRCGIASNSEGYSVVLGFYHITLEQVSTTGNQYIATNILTSGRMETGKVYHNDLCHHCHEDYIQKFLNNKENNVIK